MTFWEFLDRSAARLPGWPNERQWVTFLTAGILIGLMKMARDNGTLWNVELFKTILTVFAVTGFVNMILGFHFAANKSDEQRTVNTGEAFKAMRAVAESNTVTDTPQPVVVTNETDNPVQTEAV